MAPEVHRPLLLPQNRKLRHLRGIYLRNLTFGRPRGSTADDSAINKSPSKLAALQDGARLHHSLSSETLRPPAGRRRSTNLSNASPITRQKQLEYMADSKVADAFFSLHSEGYGEPLYISEVAEKATVWVSLYLDCEIWRPVSRRSLTFGSTEFQFPLLRAFPARILRYAFVRTHSEDMGQEISGPARLEPSDRTGRRPALSQLPRQSSKHTLSAELPRFPSPRWRLHP